MNQTASYAEIEALRGTDNWFDYAEFYAWIASQANFQRLAEVGVWKGHSLSFLARQLARRAAGADIEIYAVDLFEDSYDFADRPGVRDQLPLVGRIYDANLQTAGARSLVRDVKGRSDEAAALFPCG